MKPGRFIVLEGIDGAGTTSQTERLLAWLLDRRVRTTVDHDTVRRRTEDWRGNGLFIGVW